MDKDTTKRSDQSSLNQRSSDDKKESQASAKLGHGKMQPGQQRSTDQTSEGQPPETPSGQSNIEAPMSGSK
ncbi:hypothetical protein BGZ54_001837, partial [Gamsiella multidivaricata]